jgi:hypothetical protein
MKKLIIAIIIVILIALITIIFLFYSTNPNPGSFQQIDPYTAKFADVELHFRSNLYEAEKVEVYPDELSLKRVLLNPAIRTTWISYIPNDEENSFYLAAAFEIAFKLTIIYKGYFGGAIPIDSVDINSTDQITALETDPFIVMLGPSQTNETKIEVDGYMIKCHGKDFSEIDRTYTDLDLCVDKLLLVLMKE